MKKILTMILVASLFASPALAYAGPNGPHDDPEKPKKIDFSVAIDKAAKEVVRNDDKAALLATGTAPQEVAKGKLWTGIGMVALGVGVIWKGADLYESEPDPFGRQKNADSYLAIGVGSVITMFGALAIRGGLAGRGFD